VSASYPSPQACQATHPPPHTMNVQNTNKTLPTTAVSAPGKVLLAGGYLVLDRDYTGLVFGLNARIHVHVQPLITSSGVALEEIIVKSPQFREAIWEYGYRLTEDDGGIQVNQLRR
jgi:phosphomevalonate kinase